MNLLWLTMVYYEPTAARLTRNTKWVASLDTSFRLTWSHPRHGAWSTRSWTVQGHLAHKKPPPPRILGIGSVGLCLGSYGGPRGVDVFLWARLDKSLRIACHVPQSHPRNPEPEILDSQPYRGTSLTRKSPPPRPYRRPLPGTLPWP